MKAQSQSKARRNPWGFHRWHFKTEPPSADRGEWNEEKGIFERQLETGPSVAAYSGADRAGHVFFPGPGRADDPDNGIWLLGLVGTLSWDYMRKNRFYRELEEKMGNLEEKYLIQEMIKKPEFLEGRILYNTVKQMGKAMSDQIFEQQRRNNAFKQYVETWIHEVKLPIASMRLLLHKDRGETPGL